MPKHNSTGSSPKPPFKPMQTRQSQGLPKGSHVIAKSRRVPNFNDIAESIVRTGK